MLQGVPAGSGRICGAEDFFKVPCKTTGRDKTHSQGSVRMKAKHFFGVPSSITLANK